MYLTENQIIALFENQNITINKTTYKVYPLNGSEDKTNPHSIRIKILKVGGRRNDTRDKGSTSSFPIDLNNGHIRMDNIEYARNLKSADRKEMTDIAAGLGVYALKELLDAKEGKLDGFHSFGKKAVEFSKLTKKERKVYENLGYGKDD